LFSTNNNTTSILNGTNRTILGLPTNEIIRRQLYGIRPMLDRLLPNTRDKPDFLPFEQPLLSTNNSPSAELNQKPPEKSERSGDEYWRRRR